MNYETKLLERQQLGKKQGITETVNSTIEQLKAAGNDEQETYCFIQKLNTGLSDDTLHEMADQYY